MKIFALGDIVGSGGCDYIRNKLPTFKKQHQIDLCIANGENSAVGNGILPFSADNIFASGVDFITTGNHVFKRNEIYDYLDEHDNIIRPFNMHPSNPGKGYGIIDMGRLKVGVINLMGKAFMTGTENPFDAADEALKNLDKCKIIIVDFHAEATGEKKALGYYLDGRVSAVFGTHTHVQTADAEILENGTGYITDLGMCGAKKSVLGIKPEIIIKALRTGLPQRFTVEASDCMINGCIFEIDNQSGKTIKIQPINIS